MSAYVRIHIDRHYYHVIIHVHDIVIVYRFHHQSQVELSILELLNKKDRSNRYNIIHMKEHFMFRDHLCITFDLQG